MFSPLAALVALFVVSAPVVKKRTLVRQLAPGVELLQEITLEGDKDGPLVVTTLKIDPKVRGVRVEAALGGGTVWGNDPTLGREIPSKTVEKRKAVAGINAGFFPFAGNPIGLHVENGELVTEPGLARTAFVLLEDGTVQFPRFRFTGSVNDHPLHGLNRKPGKGNELLLFTPIFAEKTLKSPERVEAVLEGVTLPLKPGQLAGKIVSVGVGGETPLRPGTVVLSAGGESADWLKTWAQPGANVGLSLAVTPLDRTLDPKQIVQAVTGSGRLLADGKFALDLTAEKIGESFSNTRHPRTAVGVTAEGKLLFVTVDGRQPKLSRGASLKELAGILLALGAVEAVNLDGGGSSACAVRGAVLNSPSEGVERPVADSLLVFAEDAVLMPDTLSLAPPARALKVGESYRFALPESSDSGSIVWSVRGGIGFIDQEGNFRALRPGKGAVLVWRAGQPIELPVTVVKANSKELPKLDTPDFLPRAVFSDNGTTLTLTIANAEGDRLGGEPIQLTVTGGVALPNPVITNPRGEASVTLQWDANTAASARQVKLSSPQKRFQSVTVRPPSPQ